MGDKKQKFALRLLLRLASFQLVWLVTRRSFRVRLDRKRQQFQCWYCLESLTARFEKASMPPLLKRQSLRTDRPEEYRCRLSKRSPACRPDCLPLRPRSRRKIAHSLAFRFSELEEIGRAH